MTRPLRQYKITPTGRYGAPRTVMGTHGGCDYEAPVGTPVYAPVTGKVVKIAYNGNEDSGFGNNVTILGKNGYKFLLAHNEQRSLVGVGGEVVENVTKLGTVGVTGNAKLSRPHVHEEVWDPSGKRIDPEHYHSNIAPASSGGTPIEEEDMALKLKTIRNYNGSIGIIDDAGHLHPVYSMGEFNSMIRVGVVDGVPDIQPDGTVWNALTARTALNKAAVAGVDVSALAGEVAPLLISAVVEALSEDDDVDLTEAQVEAAAERALRSVLRSV